MRIKRTIKKLLLIMFWTVIGCGIITLLIAANSKEQKHTCKEVSIAIIGTGEKYYIGKTDISDMLRKGAGGRLKNKPVPQIDLARLEALLEENPWVAGAELHFDSRSVLHVRVTERQPIARVFTKKGNSFYIDSSGLRMPLLSKVSARVPVITNFTAEKKLDAKDSVLLNEIKQIAVFLSSDPFWNAQIAQVDIVDDKKFELIPVVGNHIIRIGKADHIDQKLERLFTFYQQVLGKTGFDKYGVIDLQYNRQVVAIHKGAVSSVDSVQLKKNISDLLKAGQMMQLQDSLQRVSEWMKKQHADSIARITTIKPENKNSELVRNKINPNQKEEPAKNQLSSKPVEKKKKNISKQKEEEKRPKAVMPKRG